jgi:pimeloyl-ACP methyl ester carboxylesterase
MRQDFSLITRLGNKIRYSLYFDGEKKSKPCLILVHGFKGFKDWGFWPYTSDFFSKNGFNVLSFNFSHNGLGDSVSDFIELDKFAENTISLEVDELDEIINLVKKGSIFNSDCTSIGIIGHSRGGAVSILTSAKNKNVNALAVWASVAKLDRYTDRQKKEWREKGFIEVFNSRTKQMMKLNVSLLDDIEKNKNGSLSLEKAVKNLQIPFLIIHGKQDLTVPVEEGKLLFDFSYKAKTQFEIIKAAGHTFDIEHPFETSNQKFDKVLSLTLEFLKNKLTEN